MSIGGVIIKEKTMFTAKEAVTEYFQGTISYWKLLQDFHAGKIPGAKLSARRILFRKEALDKWFEQMETNNVSPTVYPQKYQKVNMF